MKSASALELRQSLGRVIARLKKSKEPILLTKDNVPVAVLICIEDYEERFVEKHASARRQELLAQIDVLARRSAKPRAAVDILRELRADT